MGVLPRVWALPKAVMWWHGGCKSALSQDGSFPSPPDRSNLGGGVLSQGGNVCTQMCMPGIETECSFVVLNSAFSISPSCSRKL